jgi:CheY-like chemotaxis protein
MTGSRVLFAHERAAIQRAVELTLAVEGFAVESVTDGNTVLDRLQRGPIGTSRGVWDGVVLDVGLAGPPAYELVPAAKAVGARCVVLVASIYSRTSYKRRPSQLYGADDYVEIHHLGDHLPMRLRHHLGLPSREPRAGDMIRDALEAEGDSRLAPHPAERLAALIASDVVLYNGDAVARASDGDALWQTLQPDLDGARALFLDVRRRGGVADEGRDFIGEALRVLLDGMLSGGRAVPSSGGFSGVSAGEGAALDPPADPDAGPAAGHAPLASPRDDGAGA